MRTEFVAAVYSRFHFPIVSLRERKRKPISSLPNLLHLGAHMAMWRDFYKTIRTFLEFFGFNSYLEVFLEWQEQWINEEEIKMKKQRKWNACFPPLIELAINKRQLVNECLLPPFTISSKHKRERNIEANNRTECINNCIILNYHSQKQAWKTELVPRQVCAMRLLTAEVSLSDFL